MLAFPGPSDNKIPLEIIRILLQIFQQFLIPHTAFLPLLLPISQKFLHLNLLLLAAKDAIPTGIFLRILHVMDVLDLGQGYQAIVFLFEGSVAFAIGYGFIFVEAFKSEATGAGLVYGLVDGRFARWAWAVLAFLFLDFAVCEIVDCDGTWVFLAEHYDGVVFAILSGIRQIRSHELKDLKIRGLECQLFPYNLMSNAFPYEFHNIVDYSTDNRLIIGLHFNHPELEFPKVINFITKIQLFVNSQYNDNMDFHQGLSQQSDRIGKPKSTTKQLELHVASVYSEIAEMIKQVIKNLWQRGDLEIQMPVEVPTAVQRVNLIKSVLAYLLDQPVQLGQRNNDMNQSKRDDGEEHGNLECVNCENYEKNLQKLQGEIRNHIRTHQQLKLYQDGLEEKIQQNKKERKEFDKKYESVRKKYEEAKATISSNGEKWTKMEQENQKLRNQLKQIRQMGKIEEPRKQLTRYESNKQNLCEWKNTNFNNQRERDREQRSSLEKRPDSSERMRVSVNVRSTKGIPISSKIIQQKAKEEKAKALKNRLGF